MGVPQRDVARYIKAGKKIATDDVRQTIYYETKPQHSRTELSKSNYPSNKVWLFSTQIKSLDVYLFFSKSLSTSLGGQMRKEQIKTGILELIVERK